jgi:PLP dependent protein
LGNALFIGPQVSKRQNLNDVRDAISRAEKSAGREIGSVRLLAVSKGHPVSAIKEMYELGINEFGENYAQEMFSKADELSNLEIKFVYIGHLQSNKIQKIVQTASEIQTVSSFKHARYIARYAKEFNKAPFPIYLAVNAADESQKSGVKISDVPLLAKQIESELPELKLEGILSVPPKEFQDADYQDLPIVYKELAGLAKTVGAQKLSLGMSSDLKLSIRTGSTCVRIGTALFGKRPNT